VSRRRSPESSFLARARPFVSPRPRPRRKRAGQTPLMNFCNRREGRAHPRATRYPARRTRARCRRWPSKATGGGAPVTRLGVELPLHRSLRLDQASARRLERPARIEADTLVGQAVRPRSPEGLPIAPCPKARLRPAARTVRPSNEPGYLHTARNRDSSPRPFGGSNGAGEGVHFSRARRRSPGRGTPPHSRQRSRLGGSACDRIDLPAASERRSC
jgi:hypothetical protein